MRICAAIISGLIGQFAVAAYAATPPPVHWVQMAPGGAAELRIVTADETCPRVTIDGAVYATSERAPPDSNFPSRLCAMTLPAFARSATLGGTPLPLPNPSPERILVIGDTGCRIQGRTAQACNDPDKWPFATIAVQAARLNPQLIIHVGDYDYRESPCPAGNAGCAGVEWGDNWTSWKADFFTPAAPLLAAAPFVFVRGNHEECSRFGPGWLRLLGPLSFAPGDACTEHIAPYAIPLQSITLAVMDDASAPDTDAPLNQVQLYRGDLQALARLTRGPVWLATHRPISGYVRLPPFISAGGNQTLLSVVQEDGFPQNIELMLSGHIHTFEAINYFGKLPPQLISGNSGDNLDAAPADLSGLSIGGLPVSSGFSLPGFGFLLLTRERAGWDIGIYNLQGVKTRSCMFAARHIEC